MIGAYIKEQREKLGVTQKELSILIDKAMGTPNKYSGDSSKISNIELGVVRVASGELLPLAEVLGVSLTELSSIAMQDEQIRYYQYLHDKRTN